MEFLGSSVQAEQLKEIGAQLSQARQEKSISLEEVAAKTYIPLRLLNAIEAGRMDLLPEPVFIQGFIRRYGDILGLDGIALSKQFTVTAPAVPPVALTPEPPTPSSPKPAIPAPVQKAVEQPVQKAVEQPVQTPIEQSVEPAIETPPVQPAIEPPVVSSAAASRSSEPRSASWSDSQSEQSSAPAPFSVDGGGSKLPFLIGGVLGVGAIALLANALFNRPAEVTTKPAPAPTPQAAKPSNKPKSPAAPAASNTVAVPSVSPSPVTSPSPAASTAPSPSPTASPEATGTGPIQVKMNVTEDSWVEVRSDGEVIFDGTLTKGTQKTWAGKKDVTISSGNAGGVSLSFNNSAPKPMGAAGDVQTASFPSTPGQ